MPSVGLVVEGEYDGSVYSAFIERILPTAEIVAIRPCGGRAGLLRQFSGFLKLFDSFQQGGGLDLALVICDTDGKDPDELLADMQSRIESREYRSEIGLFVAHQEMETWLLADERALAFVAGKKETTKVADYLEDRQDPKDLLRERMRQLGMDYLPSSCAKLAEQSDLDMLTQRLPQFRRFRDALLAFAKGE